MGAGRCAKVYGPETERGAEGPSVQRRTAEGVEGGGGVGRGVPIPTESGVWGGGCAPPQKIFEFFI